MAIPSATGCKRKARVKCHWKREEDERLISLVIAYGPEKWDWIASYIPGRTGKSCRIRWLNQLNPLVNKTPFSAEENRLLIELQKEYGNRWSLIARHFYFRTDNHVKNQYHVLTGINRCVRAPASSPNAAPYAPLGEGSSSLSQFQSISMAPVFSQKMGPASVIGQVENLPCIGSPILRHLGIDSFDFGKSVASDANPATLGIKKGLGVDKCQFIDFLGVGKKTN